MVTTKYCTLIIFFSNLGVSSAIPIVESSKAAKKSGSNLLQQSHPPLPFLHERKKEFGNSLSRMESVDMDDDGIQSMINRMGFVPTMKEVADGAAWEGAQEFVVERELSCVLFMLLFVLLTVTQDQTKIGNFSVFIFIPFHFV